MRPNVLLIQADQHRFDCVGANGHPIVRTPNLDRLAAEGLNFSQAYCAAPVCAPSRTSLMTGQWPVQHLAIANRGTEAPRAMRPGVTLFSEMLEAAGYDLHFVGKWDVDPAHDPTHYGFHSYVPPNAYDAWRKAEGLQPPPRTNGWFGEVDPHVTPEHSRPAWEADRVIERLRALCSAGGHGASQTQVPALQSPSPTDPSDPTSTKIPARPFLLAWNPTAPHLPNVVPEPYASMYRPDGIAPWPGFADSLAGKPFIQKQQRIAWGVEGWSWERWAPTVARYLGEVTLLDAQIGRILNTLDELGIAANTLVVYTSDHGDMGGSHGMMDKHFVMYDDVVRVPLICRWPGRIAAGARTPAFVSSGIDLARTLCELAGSPVPPGYAGRSLLPVFAGGSNGREDIFAMYHGSQFGLYSQRMVRDARWKYIWNATAEDELYDLAADPGELQNLASFPAYAGELQRLRRRAVAWMDQIGDPLLNGFTRPLLGA